MVNKEEIYFLKVHYFFPGWLYHLATSSLARSLRDLTKYILKLPFSYTISYMDRLKTLDLLPLTFLHEYLNGVFFEVIYGLVLVDPSIIPKARITRPTRSSSSGVIKFVEPKCHADSNLSKVLYHQMHTRLERCC